MKKINLLKTALLAVAILFSTSIFAQHLFEINYNSVSKTEVAKLKTALTKTEIKAVSLQKNNENADYYPINLQSNQNTKIIILNEETGLNVEIIPTENAENELQLVPFLIEELKQSTLGNATHYLVFETNNNNDVKSITSVPVNNESVYVPRYFYGKKDNVKEALPPNRKILRIFKEMPHFNLEDEDSVDMQKTARDLEESLRYYVYAYLLPDGTIAIYDEHFNPTNDKDASTVAGNLTFVLTGSMNTTQRESTECGLAMWGQQVAGTIPCSIAVNWQSLGSGIIGGSYRTQNFLDSETNTWYCSAVWNQIKGQDMTSNVDINLIMSTNFTFYMQCNTNASGNINYVTIVLHEVCHGLGFYPLAGQNGNYTYTTSGGGSASTSYPGIYDRHLYSGATGVCITELTAAQRSTLFTSNNLHSGGPLIEAAHGSRVPMYSPASYASGSSTSHWAQSGYNFSGNTWMRYAYVSPLHTFNATKLAMMFSLGWTASSAPTTYAINASCGANGTITPTGVTTVNSGSSQTYTISANAFHSRATVLIDGVNNPAAVSSGTYTFTNINADHTIHATFAPFTYNVFFDANSGTGSMPNQIFSYGVAQNISNNLFTKNGATFLGWNTQANGSGTSYTNGQSAVINNTTTLFAQWTTKTQITINETPQSFVYDGLVKAFVIQNATNGLNDFNVVYNPLNPINAGTYNVTITRPEDATYAAFSTTINGGLIITKISITKPTVTSGALIYNGAAQSPTIATNTNYTITNNVQTNAGNYNATVTLTDIINYQWADATTNPLSLAWSIGTAALQVSGFNISKVYDGNVNVTSWGSLLLEGLISGQTSNVSTTGVVGSYNNANVGTAKPVSFTGTFVMTGGTAVNTNYTITQPSGLTGIITVLQITKPTVTSGTLTYNGSAQSPTIATNAAYTLTNNTQTNAGSYNAIVTLISTTNYQWADGTTTPLSLPWNITKATYNMSSVSFENATYEYDGTPKTIIITGTQPNGVTVNYVNNVQTEVGAYTAQANFIGDATNYNTIEPLYATLTITALPTFLITVNAGAGGTATGGGVYTVGEVITITAIPAEFYNFVKWDDENLDNPREITVTQDATFTAIFIINDINGNNLSTIKIYPNPVTNTLNIEGEFEKLVIYDLNGKLVLAISDKRLAINEQQPSVDVSALAKGTYIVEVSCKGKIERMKVVKQ